VQWGAARSAECGATNTNSNLIPNSNAIPTVQGVHAARQIVSLKMAIDEEEIVAKLNVALPVDIRV
jgi:tRNA U38,U39,U40 pseudouridine synthase TruA